MSDSLLRQANKAVIEQVKAEKPSKFTVGGTFNGRQAEGGATFNRTWRNGWGATAYARAWWNDAAVTPTDKFGYVIGAEGEKRF